MKNLLILIVTLGAALVLTACREDGLGTQPGGGNGGSNSTNTLAPSSLQDRTLTAQVTSGSGFFTNSGSFVITPSGSTFGPFSSTSVGGIAPTSSGTFSYVPTPGNEATLVLDDPAFGTVTMNLLFQTMSEGTFNSSSSQGGAQTGTFILQ